MSNDKPVQQLTHVLRQMLQALRQMQDEMASLRASIEALHEPAPPSAAEPAASDDGDTAPAPEAAPPPPATPAQPVRGPLVLCEEGEEPQHEFEPNGIDGVSGMPLVSLGQHAASRLASAAVEPEPLRALHRHKAEQSRQEHLGVVFGVDEDKLDKARWGILINAEEDAALLKALTPLMQHRSAQQGSTMPDLTFEEGETCGAWFNRHTGNDTSAWQRRPPVLLYHPGEDCARWLRRHGLSQGPVDPRRGVPFYLLIVGRPGPLHEGDTAFIPFDFQYELDMFWGVGRLCFTDEQGQHVLADYTAYAEQVVAFEQGAPTYRKQITYFGTRHDMDMATQKSADELIVPLTEGHHGHAAIAAQHGFAQQVFLAEAADRFTLEEILRGTTNGGQPALFFSATHGVGFPKDHELQLRHQGALLCQDWTGFGSIQREHWFAGADLPEQARIGGLIAACFACYGAGCPQEDQFVFRLNGASGGPGRTRNAIAPRALVAQLPQRLLVNGALAVLGHVERAWAHSFSGSGAAAQSQAFEDVLARIMAGKRLGFATDQFNMRQGVLSSMLANQIENMSFGKQVSRADLNALWVARNDARNYALLGDPAVRLPVEQMGD
jgi:hypothetical protein